MSRDPEVIQQEIEQARDALAVAVNQIVDRASPKHVADSARRAAVARLTSPRGKVVVGAVAALGVVAIVLRIRAARSK